MALKTDIRGMRHVYPGYFEVGREKVREFAAAIKCDDPASLNDDAAAKLGHRNLVAPLTFMTLFALIAQKDFFKAVDVGLESMQIVHVSQRFVYRRPVVAGDKLRCHFDIVSVDERFGADIVVSRNTCSTEDGDVVMESYTTLMGQRGENSVKVDIP